MIVKGVGHFVILAFSDCAPYAKERKEWSTTFEICLSIALDTAIDRKDMKEN